MNSSLFKKLSILLILLIFSCTKEELEVPTAPGPTFDVSRVEVTLHLPEGSNLNPDGLDIISYGVSAAIDPTGKAKVPFQQGASNLAYLFDKSGNFLLAGFITDAKKEISVRTTAQYLLYLGFGIPQMPLPVRSKFIREVEELPGFDDWAEKVEAQFTADPLMLQKGSFLPALQSYLAEIKSQSGASDRILSTTEEDKVAGTVAMDGNKRSGVQLSDSGLNLFRVIHSSRRRAHGFLYKMSYIGHDKNRYTILDKIDDQAHPEQEIEIPQVEGIKDLAGTLVSLLVGTIGEAVTKDSDDISLPLNSNQTQANYEFRVIGPGIGAHSDLNSIEKKKRTRLFAETVALDFVLPMIADAISLKGVVQDNSSSALMDPLNWEQLITLVINYIDMIPNIKPHIDRGDYWAALEEFMWAFTSDFGKTMFEDTVDLTVRIMNEIIQVNYKLPKIEVLMETKDKLLKALAVTDLVIKGTDYLRIIYDLKSANSFESWEVRVRGIDINISPFEFSITPLEQQKLTVNIPATIADGQVIEYEWKNTGKYGYLWDERGHKGNEFSSSINEAYYLCNTYRDQITENSVDTITVTAYLKKGQEKIKIGSSMSIVKISNFYIFQVPFEIIFEPKFLPGEGWIVNNPLVVAKFPEDPNAHHYRFHIIREDGSKGNLFWRWPHQLQKSNGMLSYGVVLGTPYLGYGISTAQKDKMVSEFEELIENARGNYKALEVIVVPNN